MNGTPPPPISFGWPRAHSPSPLARALRRRVASAAASSSRASTGSAGTTSSSMKRRTRSRSARTSGVSPYVDMGRSSFGTGIPQLDPLARGLGCRPGARRRRPEHPHRGALADRARDAELATVGLDDVLHDREPEPRTAEGTRAPLVDAEEALGQPRQVLGGDADPGVLDGDLDHAVVLGAAGDGGPHGHPAAPRRVLDRVVDQVDEHLPEAIGVGLERGARRVDPRAELDADPP